MSRTSYHHGNLRQALIDAAGQTLATAGIDGLSLRRVAQRAGVSATALYSHFADKRELLAELATDGFEQLSAAMAAEAGGREGRAELAALARGYIHFATANTALFQLMFGREIGDLPDFPGLAEAGARSYAMMADSVAREIAASGATASVAISATAAWSLVHGLATLINDGRVTAASCGVGSVDEMIERVSAMLDVTGVRPDATRA